MVLASFVLLPLPSAASTGSTLPETNVAAFLAANTDVTTVETFIAALPPLHKKHYIALHASESPAASFVSATHPRIVSWGADSRFIVTWTTDPQSPSKDQVEFLQPVPAEGKWIAGVIDFSGASPAMSQPSTCATCHSSINRPVWGGDKRLQGTEDDSSAAASSLYSTMAAATDPRIAPLDTTGYEPKPRRVPPHRSIPGIKGGWRSDHAKPNWAFSRTLILRQGEVLFGRLMKRAGTEKNIGTLLFEGSKWEFESERWGYEKKLWDMRLLSDADTPVQGWSRQEVYPHWPGRNRYFSTTSVRMHQVVQFLTQHEAWRRSANVKHALRQLTNVSRFEPSGGITWPVGLHHPKGDASAEDEMLAAHVEFFETSGQAALDARHRRRHPFPRDTASFKEYNDTFIYLFTISHAGNVINAWNAPPPLAAPTVSPIVAGPGSLRVEWTGPAVDADKISSYDIRAIRSDASDKADGQWSLSSRVWASGPRVHTLTGLLHDTSYDVQVRTVGVARHQAPGPWSTAKSGRTLSNRSPQPVGSLDAVSLQVGENAEVVDLSAAFEDPDGDALSYAASSGAAGIVTVAVSGAQVTLTPVARGAATVNVTATDASGSNTAATQTIAVRVKGRRGVTVSVDSLTVNEGEQKTYTVVLDSEPTDAVTVTPGVPAGTDVSVLPSSLSFSTTNWATPQTVAVSAQADSDAVADAAVTIAHTVTGGDYGSVSADSVEVVVVEMDTPTVSVAAATATENRGSVEFTVSLSMPSDKEVAVDYATSDDSALSAGAAADYVAATGTLKFAPTTTAVQRILVAIRDDTEDEADRETFRLTLSNVVNGTLAGGGTTLSVTGTIRDDDRPPQPPPPAPQPPPPAPQPPPPAPQPPPPAPQPPPPAPQPPPPAPQPPPPAPQPPPPAPQPPPPAPQPPPPAPQPPPPAPQPPPPAPQPPPSAVPSGLPEAGFSATTECDAEPCGVWTGESVRFQDTSTGSVSVRQWSFGDGRQSRARSPAHAWTAPGFYRVTLAVSDGEVESTESMMFLVRSANPRGSCEPTRHTLCLRESRYAVTVDWWTAEGDTGAASVVTEGTDDTGLFHFFGPENWEVLVKILNGCEVNGHDWVFSAATTTLGYTVAVTDTRTGKAWNASKAATEPTAAVTSTNAFSDACKEADLPTN